MHYSKLYKNIIPGTMRIFEEIGGLLRKTAAIIKGIALNNIAVFYSLLENLAAHDACAIIKSGIKMKVLYLGASSYVMLRTDLLSKLTYIPQR